MAGMNKGAEKPKLECVDSFYLAEDTLITAREYLVYIPKLMSGISFGNTDSTDEEISNQPKNENSGVSSNIAIQGAVRVKNMTDYRLYHEGTVEIEKVKFKVDEVSGPISNVGKWPMPPKPEYTIEKLTGEVIKIDMLNQVIMPKGTRVIGVAVGGNADDLGVIHIPGAVKLSD